MNIQQYYRLAAHISLNGSLLTLAYTISFLLPVAILLPKREIIIFFTPFLVYSFLSYQKYLIHKHRSEEITGPDVETEKTVDILESGEMLLQFLPAPSLRLLFFQPNGLLIGELRDLENRKLRWFLPYFLDKRLRQTYGLFNDKQQLIAVFRWIRNETVEISSRFSSGYGIFEPKKSNPAKKSWIFSTENRTLLIEAETFFTDIQFKNAEHVLIARVRAGWMPLEWEPYIKNPNAPVLSFDTNMRTDEKLLVFALLTYLCRYHDH